MKERDGYCQCPKCRNLSYIIWYEYGVCKRCYERHCDLDVEELSTHKHSLFVMFEVEFKRPVKKVEEQDAAL